MEPKVYRYDDIDAPICRGERVSLVEILTGCLVDGYGSKEPAGWTREYINGTGDQAAFRNTTSGTGATFSGTGFFLQVDGIDGSQAYMPAIRGYEVMVDSTTTGALNYIGGFSLLKISASAGTTARPWVLIADDRFFYFFCWFNSTGSIPTNPTTDQSIIYFGDIVPYFDGDAFACYIQASQAATGAFYMRSASASSGSYWFDGWFGRRFDGTGTSKYGWIVNGGGPSSDTTPGNLGPAYTDKLLFTRPYLADYAAYTIRGWFPGLMYPCHPYSYFTQLQELDINGVNYLVVVTNCGGDNSDRPGCLFIKLSDWRV